MVAHNNEKDQRIEAPAATIATAKASATKGSKAYDPQVLQQIIAEEKAAKGQLPEYPGLERYKLKEKMGDGAFSNVYRASDLTGQYPEVAIKVVRKFEMNSSSVSLSMPSASFFMRNMSFVIYCSIIASS